MGKIKDELLLRLFFFADADEQWRSVLLGYLADVKKMRAALDDQIRQVDLAKIPSADQRKAYFQLATMDLGHEYMKFMETWIENFMQKKDIRLY